MLYPVTVCKSNPHRRRTPSNAPSSCIQLNRLPCGIVVCLKVEQIIYTLLVLYALRCFNNLCEILLKKECVWLHFKLCATVYFCKNMNEIDRFELNEWHSIAHTALLQLSLSLFHVVFEAQNIFIQFIYIVHNSPTK